MQHLCFVVESGTDVRLVDGIAECFNLTILARRITGGCEVNYAPELPVSVIKGSASRLKFAVQVWKHIYARRKQIDCILVQGYGLAALAANLAGRFNKVPTTMLVCSPVEAYYRCREAHGDCNKPFRRRELWMLQVIAWLNALIGRHYIVLSRHLANVVLRHGTRARIDIIPIYGVDRQIFTSPKEPKKEIKARAGLPVNGTLIFFSSRIAPEKDAETLLAAVKDLLQTGHDIWLLHRSGGYKSFIKDAERFGILNRVIATDAVHPHLQLPQDYQACDLCVQASREEGLGFSPLEASSCGVPVVVSAIGGLKETITDGKTGWTYPVGDVEALSNRIKTVLADSTEASRRVALCQDMIGAKYERRMVFRQLETALSADGKI